MYYHEGLAYLEVRLFYAISAAFAVVGLVAVLVFGLRMARVLYRDLTTRMGEFRNNLVRPLDEHRRYAQATLASVERLQHKVDHIQDRFLVEIAALSGELRRQSCSFGARLGGIERSSSRLEDNWAALRAGIEPVPRVPPELAGESAAVLAEGGLPKSDEELVAVAESLAVLRPLTPYPHWRFDADWVNPDFCFQLRQRIWQRFTENDIKAPVTVPWHLGTRLRLHMNNDLSRQIFIAGCMEPNEFAFLDRVLRRGMTFLDIGANDGIYSIFAAKRVGPDGTVWAFEPSTREVGRLRSNIECNGLDVLVFPAALSDVIGKADLVVAEPQHAGLNTLGQIAYEGVGEWRREPVDLLRLDDVVAARPPSRLDVIKIDAEGAELRVLRGALETIHRYRPLVLFEILPRGLASQGTSAEELMAFVRAQGYVVHSFDHQTGLPVLATQLGSSENSSENMLAVPQEASLPDAAYSYWPVIQKEIPGPS